MALPAVAAVSFATLAFEVLLARLFAIGQWHHLSFMVISIALFGFAASGSFLGRMDLSRWSSERPEIRSARIATLCLLCSASLLAAFAGLARLPLDSFRLLLEPVQLLYLLAACLVLTLPFLFAGALVAAVYVLQPQRPGPVYAASMAGAALGAAAPGVLLGAIGENGLAALAALAPLAAVLCAAPAVFGRTAAAGASARQRRALVLGWACTCAAGIWLLTPAARDRLPPRSSEYKLLSQVLQLPDTRVLETQTGIRGRVERVRSPHLRFAPGLSLKYTEPLPPAEALFTDRDRPFFLYDPDPGAGSDFARFTLACIGHEIHGAADRVLLIGGAGGLSVACARAAGAQQIRIVQPDPNLADRIQRHYACAEVVRETPRAVLARGADRYDLIHIESWGASLPGADALQQDHLLTVDGVAAGLARLAPQGVLVIARRLLLPPSGTLRLWATVRAALVRLGQPHPERCMAMLRSWDTFALVAAREPLPDPDRILAFARRLNFDVVYLPGADESDANRYNVFDQPHHFQEIRRLEDALRAGAPGGFYRDYLLDVEPRTDLRPFPDSHLKWSRAGDLYRALGGRPAALLLSGEVVVAAVFVEALVLAAALLLIPLRAGPRGARPGRRPPLAYFFGIGAGFILAELLLIHAGTFLLGDPVISLAVVLTALLVSSGAGGLWSQRLGPAALRPALLAAAAALLLAALALWLCAQRLLALPEFWRAAALAAGAALPGAAMGVPFPLGMRFLLDQPAERAFAWAVNGCASVLGSIAAAQLAVGAGLPWLLAAALAGYALAAWGGARDRERPGAGLRFRPPMPTVRP